MNTPIRHRHAAICFAIVGLYTLGCGVGCFAYCFAFHSTFPTEKFPLAIVFLGFVSCLLSASCAWSSWTLFKRMPGSGLIATITWVLVGILALWSLISVAAAGWYISGVVVVAILGVLQFLIGIDLIERRDKTAA